MQSENRLRLGSSLLVLVLTTLLSACQPTGPAEKANIEYDFRAIGVVQLVDDIYRPLAGQYVMPPTNGWPRTAVRLITPRPVTKDEALQLIEDALKRQAHIVIHHGADGSLSALRE